MAASIRNLPPFLTKGRYRNLTVFISSIHLFDLPPACRRNVDHLLVFSNLSHRERVAIRQEWTPRFDEVQTSKFLQGIPKHEVLVIDRLKSYDESVLNHGVSLRKYKAGGVSMTKSALKVA